MQMGYFFVHTIDSSVPYTYYLCSTSLEEMMANILEPLTARGTEHHIHTSIIGGKTFIVKIPIALSWRGVRGGSPSSVLSGIALLKRRKLPFVPTQYIGNFRYTIAGQSTERVAPYALRQPLIEPLVLLSESHLRGSPTLRGSLIRILSVSIGMMKEEGYFPDLVGMGAATSFFGAVLSRTPWDPTAANLCVVSDPRSDKKQIQLLDTGLLPIRGWRPLYRFLFPVFAQLQIALLYALLEEHCSDPNERKADAFRGIKRTYDALPRWVRRVSSFCVRLSRWTQQRL